MFDVLALLVPALLTVVEGLQERYDRWTGEAAAGAPAEA